MTDGHTFIISDGVTPPPSAPTLNKVIGKLIHIKNLPSPLFAKEGHNTSLWQREDRRDFPVNVFMLLNFLVR